MNLIFAKRLGAFIIDIIILSIIYSLITMGVTVDNSNIQSKLVTVLSEYENGSITLEEYTDEVITLNYELQKSNFSINILNVILYIGYFVIFGYLNRGQTIGKKLFKIKIVNKDCAIPSICNILFRSVFIYGIITLLYSILFINVLDKSIFTYGYLIINYIESITIFVVCFMILIRKDGKGLHDFIAKTNVIEEVI